MQYLHVTSWDNFDVIPLEFVNKVQDQGLGAYEKANQNKNIPE